MANKPNGIKNETAYFYAVVNRMDKDDDIKAAKIQDHEILVKEVIYNNFSDPTDMEYQLFQSGLLGWIELIENEKLYNAIKDLKMEDQILISHVIKECKTWQELAFDYGITQANVKNRFNKIIRILKTLLFKK